ncbi:Ureidoglycolate lyase [Thelotrema lepadinum]|nr:Ureidoglycolate lyase [Thelotrema lepadinum]
MRSVLTSARRLEIEPLCRTTFQSFGDVIEDPKTTDCATWPIAKKANEGSALKYADISTITNSYPQSSGARPSISLFVCSPRHPVTDTNATIDYLQLSVLERHPFTTQTFVPMDESRGASYLVAVAPSKYTRGSMHDLPDVENMRAFIANGTQAITYGAAVWHAPMMVLGEHAITFVVTQFVNDVPEDDCEECEIKSAGYGVHIQFDRGGELHSKP